SSSDGTEWNPGFLPLSQHFFLDSAALHPGYVPNGKRPLVSSLPSCLLHDSLGSVGERELVSSLPLWAGARGRGYPAPWHPLASPLPSRERETREDWYLVRLYFQAITFCQLARAERR